MARQYILDDEDGKAAEVYVEMAQRFPQGAFAERAFWKAGWWAYRERNFAETVKFFEQGASDVSALGFSAVMALLDRRAPTIRSATPRAQPTGIGSRRPTIGIPITAGSRGPGSRSGRKPHSPPGVHRVVVTAAPPPPNAARVVSPDRARAVSTGAERAAIRAEGLGRLAAAAGDDRAGAEQAREPAPRHQRDEAGVSAVHGGRRRIAAGGHPPRACFRSTTGRFSRATRRRRGSIRTSSPRWSRRSPRSTPASARRRMRSA